VVLAEGDHVHPESVREHRFVDDLPDRGAVGQHPSRVVLGNVAEGVEPELELPPGAVVEVVHGFILLVSCGRRIDVITLVVGIRHRPVRHA
jgi:hypothetical protein